jgi:hypothetical protein
MNLVANVVLDSKQHHIASAGPLRRHRPLRLDHAADPAKVLNETEALVVRRMNDLDTQTSKIAENLDRHLCSCVRALAAN